MRRHRAVAVAAVALSCLLLGAVGMGVSQAGTAGLVAGSPTAADRPSNRPKAVAPPLKGSPSGTFGAIRSTGTSEVALTFDDGPDPVTTPKLLDLLAKHRVKATFCLVGHRVRDNKALVRRIFDEGHTLCNHSWQHLQDLSKRSDTYMFRDLEATNEQLLKAAPKAKIKYFRAPYGNFSPKLNAFAADLGMTSLSWNVDDQCWMTTKYGKGAAMRQHMFDVVKKKTRKGSIILSHDNLKPFTVTAYAKILPWLKANHTLIALPAE